MSELTHYSLQVTRLENVKHDVGKHGLYYKTQVDGQALRKGIIPARDSHIELDTLTFSLSRIPGSLSIRVKKSSNKVLGEAKTTIAELLKESRDGEADIELCDQVTRASVGTIYLHLERVELVTRVGIDVESATRCIKRILSYANFADHNESIASFFEAADKAVDAIKGVAKVNSYLEFAWDAVSFLYKIVSNQFKTDKALVDMVKAMTDAFEFAREANALSDKNQKLTGVIGDLLAETIECCFFAEGYVEKNFFGRIFHVNNSWKIEGHTAHLIELRGQLDTSIGLQTAVGVEYVMHKVDQIGSKQHLRVLQERLEPTRSDPGNHPRCLENTRTTYLAQVIDWLGSSPNQNIFWLTGIAGSGKSTIAATVRDLCEQKSCLAAYLFFERGKDEFKSVIRSIAYQLAEHNETLRSYIVSAAERHKHIAGSSSVEQFKTLLLEPLKAAANVVKGPIVTILDALDECGEAEQRREILKLLKTDFAELPVMFRFLITSRPENDILTFLSSREHIREVQLDHTSDDSRRDVGAYIENELRELVADGLDVDEWNVMITTVSDAADGLFIWASTTIKMVRASDDPLEQLQDLIRDITSLDNYDLDSLYVMVLKQSGINWENPASRDRFTKVIGFILLAKESVTSELVDNMLRIKVGKSRLTLQRLKSVVLFEPGKPVRIHHASFGDYVTSPDRSGDRQWFIDVETAKRTTAAACFETMARLLHFNICDLETSFVRNDKVPHLGQRLEENIPPWLSYACLYWAEHLFDVEYSADTHDLLDHLRKFAYSLLLYWFEVLSLTGSFNRIACQSLFNASSWTSTNDSELSSFLWDGYKFASYFSVPISQSAPHVYLSALSLWRKTDSNIFHHYSTRHPIIPVHVPGSEPLDACIRVSMSEHEDFTSLSVSPDGKYIASCGPREILIRDARSGELVLDPLVARGMTGWFQSVSFMLSERKIVAINEYSELFAWSLDTGDLIRGPFSLQSADLPSAIAFSPDGKRVAISTSFHSSTSFASFSDNLIRIWDVDDGALVASPLKGHLALVTALIFSRNGDLIVSGSRDRSVRVWEARSGVSVCEPLVGHTGDVISVDISPNGKYIVSGSRDLTVRVWDLCSGTTKWGPVNCYSDRNCVAFSSNGNLIATSSYDSIRIWNVASGELLSGPFEGHSAHVSSLAFLPDGKCLVSSSLNDGTMRIWDVQSRSVAVRDYNGHKDHITSVAFSPSTRLIVSGSEDASVCIWEVQTGMLLSGPLKRHTKRVSCVVFSSNEKHVASGSHDDSVWIWDVKCGEVIAGPLRKHGGKVNSVSFSPDGKQLVSGSRDCTVLVWDVETGSVVLGPLEGHTKPVNSVVFSSEGRCIFSGCDDGSIYGWNARSGEVTLGPLQVSKVSVLSIAVTTDGRQIISGYETGAVHIWDIETGELLSHLPDASASVEILGRPLAFSPGGKSVAFTFDDGSVRVSDARDAQDIENSRIVLKPFLGTDENWERDCCVVFSPCGKFIASSAIDRTLRIWNVEEANETPYAKGTKHSLTTATNKASITSQSSTFSGPTRLKGARTSTTRPNECGTSNWDEEGWSFDFDDGWIRGDKGELIIWFPEDRRSTLCGWHNTIILNRSSSTTLDLANAPLGVNWCKGYPLSSREEEGPIVATTQEHTAPLHHHLNQTEETRLTKRRRMQ